MVSPIWFWVCFNTKKVRLKQRWFALCGEHDHFVCFNTKKVRLKPVIFESSTKTSLRFQYQKGAIKTICGKIFSVLSGAFQYQKGAIKTPVFNQLLQPLFRFQYQKGAIKTSNLGAVGPVGPSRFNTKKVRLKPLSGGV